jgi:hypothetical protein
MPERTEPATVAAIMMPMEELSVLTVGTIDTGVDVFTIVAISAIGVVV